MLMRQYNNSTGHTSIKQTNNSLQIENVDQCTKQHKMNNNINPSNQTIRIENNIIRFK